MTIEALSNPALVSVLMDKAYPLDDYTVFARAWPYRPGVIMEVHSVLRSSAPAVSKDDLKGIDIWIGNMSVGGRIT